MPELPEVETTRRGVMPYLVGRRIVAVTVREARLRWPVPANLEALLCNRQVLGIDRRGKYLLIRFEQGTLLVHLGMSGSLRVVEQAETGLRKHDHVDLHLEDGRILRYHDPRRFGAFLWLEGNPLQHSLLRDLGPEPLEPDFDGDYLHARARGRRSAVKQLLMDGRIVVGVGNIYANEALCLAGIHPLRQAGRVSLRRYRTLADAVRTVLGNAIAQGGTTLRDYVNGTGSPGYFSLSLRVYGREGEPCLHCGQPIRAVRSAQRATFYCSNCQT
ncbi:MAG: bifunctional DNA-formamidopyrimidine glycosylase/DNA-(apurinic or apyrimidinic site) lyase [Pseudomonadales bacterium]|nr:bifunctional DNA-formamidopyrimidine glycosylase/DNA-(apurinic or apyrimidinic site) lyase [Pseudomonadales bacterium]